MATIESAVSGVPIEKVVEELLAKQAIAEVIYRRARANDRRDTELALSCYHDDATEVHGAFDGAARDFILYESHSAPSSEKKSPMRSILHLINQVLVEVDGNDAVAETYCVAIAVQDRDGEVEDVVVAARFLDRFARRHGAWKISHRDVVYDWSRVEPAGVRLWDGQDPSNFLLGVFGLNDPVYTRLLATSVRKPSPRA